MKEAELQTAVHKYLNISGLWFRRAPVGGVAHSIGGKVIFKKSPLVGFPDFFGYLKNGRGWVIELKTAKGRLSPEQSSMRTQLERTNVLYCLGRSLCDVIDFIKHIKLMDSTHGLVTDPSICIPTNHESPEPNQSSEGVSSVA